MLIDENEPRPQRGEALRALAREDLDLLGVEELQERVEALQAEIARSRVAMDGKRSRKSAAGWRRNVRRVLA